MPEGMTSWSFFDALLERAGVVGTPGCGFGPSGEGYFRLTAFATYEDTVEAVRRIQAMEGSSGRGNMRRGTQRAGGPEPGSAPGRGTRAGECAGRGIWAGN